MHCKKWEQKFMFDYIKNWYTIIADKLFITDVIYISGESRIGKSFLAKSCMGRISDQEYYKLYLKSYSNYNPSYSPFLLGFMKSDSNYEASRTLILDFLNSSKNSRIKLLGEIMEYSRTYREKRFSQLNDMELSIINRISFHCNGRSLFLVVDDFEKWDQNSKNLLYFFMTQEAKEVFPFLKKSKIIIASTEINAFHSIREFYPNVFPVKLVGYTEEKDFVKDLIETNKSDNESLLKTLYNITKGNPGLSCDVLTYIKNGSSYDDSNVIWNISEYKTLFSNILYNRISNIDKEQPNFIHTIKAASVIGEIFNQIFLPEIIEENEFSISKSLSIAQSNHFIDIFDNTNFIYSFFNNIIYNYFDENFNENKKEYHYKFALAIKKLRSDDYYMQFHHLRASGKIFEATEVLAIYLIRQEISSYVIDEELRVYLKNHNCILYDNYEIISQSVKDFYKGFYKKALSHLEMVAPVSEILIQEKDYLKALYIYDAGYNEEFQEAYDILSENYESLLNTNFDMWLRSSILFYIFCVNRLSLESTAKTIEKKIVKEVAKKYKYNSDLETIVHILNRNSSAIYSIEIALHKIEKSVIYFKHHASQQPLQYLMALTNYAGTLLVASEYKSAFHYANEGIIFLNEKKIWTKDIEKVINNYLVSGYFSKNLSCSEILESFERLLADSVLKNKVLLLNNYYIFKMLCGKVENLYEKFYTLFQSDAVQKHNDYYVYLTGINLICIALITNQYKNAEMVFKELDNMIPSICSKEKEYITMRYRAYEKIIFQNQSQYITLKELERFFNEELSMCSYDYVKRPYIITDQQFWSLI